jgi:hypothetical protein
MQELQVKRSAPIKKIARRRLLGVAAAAGVCGAGLIAAPQLVPLAEQQVKAAALADLKQLEGVSLDAAIEAAEITRAGVKYIVVPVARLLSILGSGALNLVSAALGAAHNAMSLLHISTTVIDALSTMIQSWQQGLASLPISLDAYANADITSAEAYLKALKQVVAQH